MNTSHSTRTFAVLAAALSLMPTLAHAHPGHGAGFGSGIAHPVSGLDHLLAMVAIGIWAAQLGGRARWAVPAAFVGVMLAGSTCGMAGLSLPYIDAAILASVVVLGLLILTATRLPLAASLALVGSFAFVHGLAHGMELPANTSGLGFAAGFALATAALHACGFAIAAGIRQLAAAPSIRLAGGAIALAGLMLTLH